MFSLNVFLLMQNLIEGFSGEKAQKLRALAVLPEDTRSLPMTHSRKLTIAQSRGGGDPILCIILCRHTHVHL